jgi:beta-RFAP synthase
LHFGLLNPAGTGPAARRFGGAGLMVRDPGLSVRIEPAAAWAAEGPLAERALACARHFAQSFPAGTISPHRLIVERAAPQHMGLGTGTQLALAVGRALAVAAGAGGLTTADLAARAGRGRRSAVGVHGFAHGGFLVDAGKRAGQGVAPLVARADFPEEWGIVLVLPPWGAGLHGSLEAAAFAKLTAEKTDGKETDHLCRLILLEMLPALAERDCHALGEAVFQFNRTVGEMFRSLQGGPYAHPQTGPVIDFIRKQPIAGAGQSSWGPGLFAITEHRPQAVELATQIQRHFNLQPHEVIATCAQNCPALAETGHETASPKS